jgi:hypothetical protein
MGPADYPKGGIDKAVQGAYTMVEIKGVFDNVMAHRLAR